MISLVHCYLFKEVRYVELAYTATFEFYRLPLRKTAKKQLAQI